MKIHFNGTPTTIYLNEKFCDCGKKIGGRNIIIKSFADFGAPISESTLRIWNNKKCCWRCKVKPNVGELWFLSLNLGEPNRLFCAKCGEFIMSQLQPTTASCQPSQEHKHTTKE
jgi:hypothetical protein